MEDAKSGSSLVSRGGQPTRAWVGVDYSIKVKNSSGVTIRTSLSNNAGLTGTISFSDISGTLDASRITGLRSFATLADLIASKTVTIGDHVFTKEYSIGNGGGNRYEIVAAGTGTDDGGSYIDLSGSGLQPKSLSPNLTAEQFGAIGDNSTNNTTAVQKAAAACNGVLRFGAGTFKMNVIGIQGVLFVGAGMGRTIIKAFSSGTGFILDSQLNTDGVTTNTNGLFGGAKSLLIDGDLKGYDGVRTYGGFATL